jgi:integrase
MSVKVTPWKSEGKWMVTIRFRWPDTDRPPCRDRKVIDARSEKAARDWGEARESKLRAAGAPKPEDQRTKGRQVPTLGEFAPRFLQDFAVADGHAEGGVEAKESVLRIHLLPHLGDKRLDEIKNADIQRLKTTWRAGVIDVTTGRATVKATSRIKTINNRLSVLSKLLKVAAEWKEETGLLEMPCDIRLIKGDDSEEMGFYDDRTYESLVEAGASIGVDEHLTVLLGGDAGLRRGEILGLKPGDVVGNKLHVQRQIYYAKVPGTKTRRPIIKSTKGKEKRWVPLTPRLVAVLAKRIALPRTWVLERQDGAHLTPKLIRTLMEAVELKVNAKEEGPNLPVTGRLHILRHSFCSHLAMAGATASAIQALAGHKRLETTLKYMHLSPCATDEAVRLLVVRQEAQAAERANGLPTAHQK